MANTIPGAGELNRVVALYEYSATTNASGEAVKTPVLLGNKFVKRIDAVAGEDDDGRLIPLNVCRYIMRYTEALLTEGTKYMVRDVDGDYLVNSVTHYGNERKRFLELKCGKRGD